MSYQSYDGTLRDALFVEGIPPKMISNLLLVGRSEDKSLLLWELY